MTGISLGSRVEHGLQGFSQFVNPQYCSIVRDVDRKDGGVKGKFQFAVMGAGNISGKFCEAVQLIADCEVVAIASKDMTRAQQAAHKHGIDKAYDNYEQMLETEKPDAVYIGVTTNAHYELTMLCLDYKIPVLCEKAMFQNQAQAEAVFQRSRELQVFVMEGMWSRFLPNLTCARKWIQKGTIGDVTLATINIGFQAPKDRENRYYNPALGGGACYDLMVYCYDILTWILDRQVLDCKIQALFTEDGVDKTEAILLRFADCIGVLTASFEADLGEYEQAIIYGSKGKVVIPHPHIGNACTLYVDGGEPVFYRDEVTTNGFVYEIREVMECIQQGEIESKIAPHAMTLETSKLYDEILG